MALNTITIVKLPDGKEVVIADWTDIPLFSSVDILSGATNQQIDLFQLEAGRQVPFAATGTGAGTVTPRTATTNDTNIATPGAMASDEEMLVYAIKPEVSSYTVALAPLVIANRTQTGIGQPVPSLLMIAALQQTYLIQLEISQKLYAQAGFGYFNTGFGPFGVADIVPGVAANPSRHLANNGLPSQEAIRSFVIPAHIGGQEKFRVSLINEPGNAVQLGGLENTGGQTNATTILATVKIYLDGLRKRPTA